MYRLLDLIVMIDELDDICIITENYHKLYYGRVMNIPEYLLTYSIIENSLSVDMDDTNYPYFIVKVAVN